MAELILVGVAHVLNLKEKIKEIIEEEEPDALAIELDEERAHVLMKGGGGKSKFIYSLLSKTQSIIAKKFGVRAGSEMLAVIETAVEKNLPLIFIDMRAREVMEKLWRELSLKEKITLVLSSIFVIFLGKKRIIREIEKFQEEPEKAMENMEKSHPKIKKILIDERNEYMAKKLVQHLSIYGKIVAFVGEGHIIGIKKLLENFVEIKVIHLSNLN